MKTKLAISALISAAMFASVSSQATANSITDVTRTGLDKEVIYFVMPDRYRNADTSNDNLPGFNPSHTAFFHGGDLKGLTGNCVDDDGLVRLKKLGFTAIWLTPLVVQQPPTDGGAGYHGYWGVDFLNVDPHLGTNADLAALKVCADKLGLKLILDVVTNHTGDIIWYNDRNVYIPEKFKGIKNPEWLNDISNYHNTGSMERCWSEGPCQKNGDFYGLDDLATEKPGVYNGWGQVYGEWIKKYGFVGFRVDTARHVDDEFFKNWSPLVNQAAADAGIKNFTIFGEVWEQNPVDLVGYIRNNKLQTALDFPFQKFAVEYAAESSSADILKNLFEYDDYYSSSNSSAANLVTFLGNHDMGRAAFIIERTKINPSGQLLSRVKIANTLLYLSRGIPTVYYGDEVGMLGTDSGNDQKARQDMFPTQVEIWKDEKRLAAKQVGNGDSFQGTFSHPVAKHLIKLSELRKAHPALANAQMQIRYAKGSVFAFSKRDLASKREYVVVINNSNKAKKVSFTTASNSGWNTLLGKPGISSKNTTLTVDIAALDAVVLQAKKDITKVEVKVGKIAAKEDFLSGYHRLTAGVQSTDLAVTEFFVKGEGQTSWKSLGVDLNSPYRVYLDPKEHSGKLQVKAVVTSSQGRTYELPSIALNIATP
jgi:glycosidase